jgi:hypothetical protein
VSYAITVLIAVSTVLVAAGLLAWAGRMADRWGRTQRRGPADHPFGA